MRQLQRLALVERVRESNRQAQNAWTRWAPHRARVMEVFSALPDNAARICLLGAGHLHDVSLPALRRRYSEIALVDLDAETVAGALARHGFTAGCAVHAPFDLTGIIEQLERGASERVSAVDLLARLAGHRCSLPGAPFDVTASLGVLTQMLQALVDADVGSDLGAVSIALRDKHLLDLVQLTRPGGSIVLVTDVVSTSTAPALRHAAPHDLERSLAGLVAARNFFTGTNPYRIIALLEEDERFRGRLTDVRLVGPWLWDITDDRQHLTCAITAQRGELEQPAKIRRY